MLPRRFGRYLLFDRIGRGGMADIYLARAETGMGAARRVVVKQILPQLSRNPRFARMLIEEAKLVAGLSHGNIAQVLDLGREGERLFITMEYVEGYDLNQLLARLSKRDIPLPAQFALFVVRGVLAGLDFAHRKRDEEGRSLAIVHRDVSPSNVLVSFEGEVKLCDFGIARAFGIGAGVDEGGLDAGAVAGKAAYMSPEHARGGEVDARSDVFSAGIVLYELCAGRRLYKGTEAQMLELARGARVPPLPEGRLPEQAKLQALLDRALAIDPAARFESAGEMLRALDDYAMEAKLFVSQLRFASFLTDHFEAEVVEVRRARERAAEAEVDRSAAALEPERSEPAPPPPADTVQTGIDVAGAARARPAISAEARGLAGDVTRPLPASPARRARRRVGLLVVGIGVATLLLGAAVATALLVGFG